VACVSAWVSRGIPCWCSGKNGRRETQRFAHDHEGDVAFRLDLEKKKTKNGHDFTVGLVCAGLHWAWQFVPLGNSSIHHFCFPFCSALFLSINAPIR